MRTDTGWQVLGREDDTDGRAVTYLDDETTARATLRRMLDTAPPELSHRARITQYPRSPVT